MNFTEMPHLVLFSEGFLFSLQENCNLVVWLSGSCLLFTKRIKAPFCFLVLFISFHLITHTACHSGLSAGPSVSKAGSVAEVHR